jgi:trafficking protein particle complex subunit 8
MISSPASPSTPNGFPSPNAPPLHRRLAEFSTFLGDYKLAVPLWESIRKEGKGGSDVLPMLLAPSLTLEAHAAYALSPLTAPEQKLTAAAQLKALRYAVRWEQGVQDLLQLGGERWLVWAAGSVSEILVARVRLLTWTLKAEEPALALLLAQGALISLRKGSRRTAAMWYVFAANRLEKCGVVCAGTNLPYCMLEFTLTLETVDDVLSATGLRIVHATPGENTIALFR